MFVWFGFFLFFLFGFVFRSDCKDFYFLFIFVGFFFFLMGFLGGVLVDLFLMFAISLVMIKVLKVIIFLSFLVDFVRLFVVFVRWM